MSGEPFPVSVTEVLLPFRCVDAGPRPGPEIAEQFEQAWPSYRRWFLHEGELPRPSYAQSRAALRRWMPELVGDYDALVDAVGGDDLKARFLSHWCPPALVSACSIAMLGGPEPILVRNYDYPAFLSDTLALRTHWSGRTILGMSDCGWGLMDGMNDAGLAVSIAFGGRRVAGEGFGIGIVVRYLLQRATTTTDAVRLLSRIPVHMSYNVAIVDAAGDRRIVYVAPDRAAQESWAWAACNRQGHTEWPAHADYCRTVEREEALAVLSQDDALSGDDLVSAFLRPPLHRSLSESTWGTIYTAAYRAHSGVLALLWPGDEWSLPVSGHTVGEHPRRELALVPDPVTVRVEVPRPEGIAVVR